MIAPAVQRSGPTSLSAWQEGFLEMVPAIRRHATIALGGLSAEAREDAVAEVVASALVAYRRLAERGKVELAYPRVLARYGVAQFFEGRRVGTPLNAKDVLSPYAQRKAGFSVAHLDRFDEEEGQWKELLVEDRRATPAEVAAWRMDFAAWLARLAPRMRKIALTLAVGESGTEAARKLSVSEGRISQLRRWFENDWRAFHGEKPAETSLPTSNRPRSKRPRRRKSASLPTIRLAAG